MDEHGTGCHWLLCLSKKKLRKRGNSRSAQKSRIKEKFISQRKFPLEASNTVETLAQTADTIRQLVSPLHISRARSRPQGEARTERNTPDSKGLPPPECC